MPIQFRQFILLLIVAGFNAPVAALDFRIIDTTGEDGAPYAAGKIRILSVYRLLDTAVNGQRMVELSALAWSEDENILYALSDHGSVFHFRPEFNAQGLSGIRLLDAYPLRDAGKQALGYPWSDSEGLALKKWR